MFLIADDVIGQVYHALLQEREDKGIKDVAISRVEQLSPFPYDLVRLLLCYNLYEC
jgi:2-oxoglutarate dehydrogenase complex dehydrogenase (E1) component-like enzyme